MATWVRGGWMVGLVAGLLLAPAAWAHPEVDAARAGYENGSYTLALSRLDRAEKDPALTQREIVQIRWLRAASLFALRRLPAARAALDDLLALEPLFEPPPAEASPPLRALFRARQEAYLKAHGVEVGVPSLEPPEVRLPLTGHLEEVGQVLVFVRPGGSVAYKPFVVDVVAQEARGALQDEALWERIKEAGALDLVVEVRNRTHGALARRGSAVAPLSIPVAAGDVDKALALLRSLDAPPAPTDPLPANPSEALLPWSPPETKPIPPVVTPRMPAPTAAPAPVAATAPKHGGSKPPPTASTPVDPAGPSGPRPGWLAAGGLGALAAAGLLPVLAGTVLGVSGYVAALAHPRTVGAEVSPTYRAAVGAFLGGSAVGALGLLMVIGLGATAASVLAVSLAMDL